jgi:hypothetical protein
VLFEQIPLAITFLTCIGVFLLIRVPQFSYPGAHAQNGIAERKHHHILETSRPLLLSSELPPHFWAEAISTAVFLINRQPSSVLHRCTPYERLFGHSSHYSHLRCFRCVCFVLLPPRERTKLTAQSVECVFLGYSTEHKGYRCYDPVACRMRISQDVTFDESHSYCPHSSSRSSTTTESLSLLTLLLPPSHSSLPPPTFPPPAAPTTVLPPPLDTPSCEPTPDPSPSLLGPHPAEVPSREITHVYTRRPRPPPPLPSESSPSLLGPTPEMPSWYDLRDRSALRPPEHFGFTVATLVEPTTYREAAAHLDWQHAMAEELATLECTGTWDLVPLPPQATPITCKWVYNIKTHYDSSLECYKARLVARGF